jgi:uncharacterized protein (DUF2141 family)
MKLIYSILLILLALPTFSQILKVEISGIRTEKGVIQLSVYRDQKTFKEETPFRVYTIEKKGMVDGKITETITDLLPGTYGIALIDDKNVNGKMDYRFFIPIEGFGFSNHEFKGTCKPDFKVFSFELNGEKTTIQIQVQYF